MKSSLYSLLFTSLLFLNACSPAYKPEYKEAEASLGPEKGTLLIIGGAARDPLFLKLFKEYAGGDTAHIIVVPTAYDDNQIKKDSAFIHLRAKFEQAGFKNIRIMHTRDKAVANSEAFIAPIKKASGVYFMGGRQWRIADGFLNTRAHEAFKKLLDRGGIIAGSSAGATIQGSFLARGDTKTNTIMMGDHQQGLAFMKNVAIDQHILARNRQFDLFQILKKHPQLLGIGLDENTAIVVKHNTFEVVGNHYVALYDGTFWSRDKDSIYKLPEHTEKFYFLKSGDRYDLEHRRVIRD
jgi:cyanophycinase